MKTGEEMVGRLIFFLAESEEAKQVKPVGGQ